MRSYGKMFVLGDNGSKTTENEENIIGLVRTKEDNGTINSVN